MKFVSRMLDILKVGATLALMLFVGFSAIVMTCVFATTLRDLAGFMLLVSLAVISDAVYRLFTDLLFLPMLIVSALIVAMYFGTASPTLPKSGTFVTRGNRMLSPTESRKINLKHIEMSREHRMRVRARRRQSSKPRE